MKIGIDMGHTLVGPDYGEVGYKNEFTLTRDLGNVVINELKKLGNTVINCTVNQSNSIEKSLSDRVDKANSNHIDMFVSIHFNVGLENGSQIYTLNGSKFPEANNVLNRLVSLGFRNKGIKDGSDLYLLKNIKSKSMIIEVALLDSKEDMTRYNNYGPKIIGKAIAKGLTFK